MAPGHDGIAQDDIHLITAPENDIRTERDVCGRCSLKQDRADRIGQFRCSHGFFGAHAKDHNDRPDLDLVPGLKSDPTRNTVSIDCGPALTAKILNEPGFVFEQNPAMTPRHFGMASDQVNLRSAANDDIFAAQQFRACWEPGENGDRRFQS